jgi:sigma-B regulation protein RsbU (phosphoserine phosphatase)
VKRLKANGTVVGLLPDATYEPQEVILAAQDVFALFSDGVTEALDANGREYGEERLIAALHRHARLPAAELLDRVLADVSSFCGGTAQHDDISLVVARAR